MTTGAVLLFLLVNSIADIRRREIVLLPTILFGIGGVVFQGALLPESRSSGSFLLLLLLSLLPGLFLLAVSLTGGTVGAGDAIALCALGAWTGGGTAGLTLCIGLLLVSLAGLLPKRVGKELPFLPFLLGGFLLQLFLKGG